MSDFFTPIAELPLEQQAMRAKCVHPTGTFVAFQEAELEQSLSERFEQQVEHFHDCMAVKAAHRAFTYHELNQAANRVAREILATQGNGPEPVGLLFEHGVQAITAILGVLKAGKFYIPLDPAFPHARIASIVEDSGTRLLVTDGHNCRFASALTCGRLRLLDVDTLDARVADENLSLPVSPADLACVIYTSGSTGQPKGVMQTHRGLLHWAMVYTNDLHITPHDRLTLLHSWSAPSCLHHLFDSLLNGAALLPFDPRLGGGAPLARWLIDEQVTMYHSVPVVFRQMAAALTGQEVFPCLRTINLSGAPMARNDVELYKRYFPAACVLLHMIGTTETGWMRRYFIDQSTPLAGSVVPVGYAVQDTADVIARALALADVAPEAVSYVEAHGTGTVLGDPIEIAGLTRAFRAGTGKRGFCAIGSVKTNIGHLGAAAGVTGLIKTVLALTHEELPPSLHFVRPNPQIDFSDSPFYVQTTLGHRTG